MHLSEMPNRNPVEEHRAHHRLDPYWDGLWGSRDAVWHTTGTIRRMLESGLIGTPSLWMRTAGKLDSRDAIDRLGGVAAMPGRSASPPTRTLALQGLASALMWRTPTLQQVIAMSGRTEWVGAKDRVLPMELLFNAGMVDCGVVPRPDGRMPAHVRSLVAPASGAKWGQLLARLPLEERVGVTAGIVPRRGSQADRHNVLTTELCLRAAEVLPIRAVAGEHLCSIPRMYGDEIDIPQAAVRFAADGMLVRTDGLRIMVETTASVDADRKLARWASVLASDRRGKRMVVVFVHVPHPDAPSNGDWERLREKVRQFSSRFALDGVPGRMFTATWKDWFPARHEVTQRFRTLTAECPTGVAVQGPPGSGWEARSLLDPFDVEGPADTDAALALVSNMRHLYGVPHWLRGTEESLFDAWLARSGHRPFGRPCPSTPVEERKEHSWRPSVGA